jgi:TRAP-type mannitol/chloroaromatic compound transport system permease large subunit
VVLLSLIALPQMLASGYNKQIVLWLPKAVGLLE